MYSYLPVRFILFCFNIRRRQWHPTPVLLPEESHGWRSLVGYSPWGREESDTTERLHFHFSLSCFGEGNGNPLQCSCLENPRAGGVWWAAVYGVAQSRTRLKWLSSSSREQEKGSSWDGENQREGAPDYIKKKKMKYWLSLWLTSWSIQGWRSLKSSQLMLKDWTEIKLLLKGEFPYQVQRS